MHRKLGSPSPYSYIPGIIKNNKNKGYVKLSIRQIFKQFRN